MTALGSAGEGHVAQRVRCSVFGWYSAVLDVRLYSAVIGAKFEALLPA